MGKTFYGYCCTRRSNELSSPSPPAKWNWRRGSNFPRKTPLFANFAPDLAEWVEFLQRNAALTERLGYAFGTAAWWICLAIVPAAFRLQLTPENIMGNAAGFLNPAAGLV